MELDEVLAACRRRTGWSLRRLAGHAHTSHATLSAYEHGRVRPGIDTIDRIARVTGHRLEVRLEPTVADAHERGRELEAVLDLAEEFPVRQARRLAMPVFGRPAARADAA